MKTVFVNGRFMCRQMTGVDRFANEILLAADRLLGLPEFKHLKMVVLLPTQPLQPTHFSNITLRVVPVAHGHAWEQLVLPLLTVGRPLLNLCNTGPVFKREHFTTIHDATTVRMPEAFSKAFRLWYRFLMPWLGATARQVLTVSEFAKKDITAAFGIAPDKVSVLGEGGDHIHRHVSDTGILARHGLDKQRFFLAVSSNAPHKNFKLIAEAAASAQLHGVKIAIAGGSNQRVFGQAGGADHADIVRLGYVTDAELKVLYERATAFLFPSLHEGFGLPLVEAMELGCPVISSNAASMPEVCADAALYFDPHDARQLLAHMQSLATDPALCARLSAAARQRAKHWKWDLAARNLLKWVV